MATLSRVIVVVSAVVSGGLLFLTLRRAAKEVRVRPGLEWARIAVGLGGVIAMGAIVGAQTPAVVAAGAVGAGAAIGFLQGQQTTVTVRDSQVWAHRTLWGVMLFSAGLISMQLTGLGTRTGTFKVGQAISLFSISVALGLIVGRPRPIPTRSSATRQPSS